MPVSVLEEQSSCRSLLFSTFARIFRTQEKGEDHDLYGRSKGRPKSQWRMNHSFPFGQPSLGSDHANPQ